MHALINLLILESTGIVLVGALYLAIDHGRKS
jgi:hypothetical protein